MERKISWSTGCFDEIELVYEKAEKDPYIGEILSNLEKKALSEARKNRWVQAFYDPPALDRPLKDQDKEKIIYHLADFGLLEFIPSPTEPVITVTFSEIIQELMGCAIFSLLNRLEKLDGSYNEILFPKATLNLQIPLGCRKGMIQWEMMIVHLYPWLAVTETSIQGKVGNA